MKKKFIFLCVAFVTLFSANIFAAEYDLWVRGIQITDENKDVAQRVFDPETNTLTLKSWTPVATETLAVIESQLEDLTIVLKGENVLSSTGGAIIDATGNVTITGDGSLTAKTENSSAFYIDDAVLEINNTKVNIAGAFGINAAYTVRINKSEVTINATSACIKDCGDLVLDRCKILSPSGAQFAADEKAILDGTGNVLKGELKIGFASYELKIATTSVTDANADDILSDGTASYNPTTNTLTLNGANIETYMDKAIDVENSLSGIKIELVGQNKVKGKLVGIMLYNGTITGSGSLEVSDTEQGAGIMFGTQLTIKNTTVTATGSEYGIVGTIAGLIIEKSVVKATGTNKGSIALVNQLTMLDCNILSPEGAYYKANEFAVVDAEANVITNEIVIGYDYGLTVSGQQVSVLNQDDILGDGKVSYDPATKTLKLNNAETGSIENSEIADLTIELIGKNSITTASGDGLDVYANTTITGEGSLAIDAPFAGILLSSERELTIKNTTVTVNGGSFGVLGSGDTTETLLINNSVVKVTGTGIGSIVDIKTLDLVDCEIVKPDDAVFVNAKHGVYIGNDLVQEQILIAPTYKLTISGVKVTAENAADVLETGEVSYNPETNTLTLNNATIENETAAIISNGIEGLTIELVGTNKISGATGIIISANAKIKGYGSLDAQGANMGIYLTMANLEIDGTTVTASGKSGISGLHLFTSENLTVKNSNVKATGNVNGSIVGLTSLTLSDCQIVAPANAQFVAAQLAVCVDNVIEKGEVEIKASALPVTSVENIEETATIFARNGRIFGAENAKIYDLLGRDVTRMNGNLQGVYVVKTNDKSQKIIVR